MERLTGAIRPYAWGSRRFLAQLQGRPVPSPTPEAELWLGAHPASPALLQRGQLDAVIAADPTAVLGSATVAEFGARLPFLLKVLAAEEPLSLQAHPDAARAAARFAAGDINYVDDQHKPELLVALESFEVLCGFRPPQETAERLAPVPALAPVVAVLRRGDLRAAVQMLLESAPDMVDAVLAQASSLPATDRDLVTDLAKRYPGDRGAIVALLLNHVTLAPGEAIFMPAGNVHAYLRGAGVEIMASSDNVLRGGLTHKRVDVAELLEVVRFEPLIDPVVRSRSIAPGVVDWPVPVREFSLQRATVTDAPVVLTAAGARILLCTAGRVAVGGVELAAGEAAFAPAGEGPVKVTGCGEVYQASVAACG